MWVFAIFASRGRGVCLEWFPIVLWLFIIFVYYLFIYLFLFSRTFIDNRIYFLTNLSCINMINNNNNKVYNNEQHYKFLLAQDKGYLQKKPNTNGIKALWFVNHESVFWSHKPEICKTSIFYKLFFLKYDSFKIIRADSICLSSYLEFNEWDWTMKEKNSVECFGLL